MREQATNFPPTVGDFPKDGVFRSLGVPDDVRVFHRHHRIEKCDSIPVFLTHHGILEPIHVSGASFKRPAHIFHKSLGISAAAPKLGCHEFPALSGMIRMVFAHVGIAPTAPLPQFLLKRARAPASRLPPPDEPPERLLLFREFRKLGRTHIASQHGPRQTRRKFPRLFIICRKQGFQFPGQTHLLALELLNSPNRFFCIRERFTRCAAEPESEPFGKRISASVHDP